MLDDNKRRITRRHWAAMLFLMVVLGIIAVWNNATAEDRSSSLAPITVTGAEFGMTINADGTPGVRVNGTYSGMIEGRMVRDMPIEYTIANGIAVYEGDILLPTAGLTQAGMGIIPQDRYRWPDGLVPYEIHKSLANPQRVYDAIEHWETHTSIRFVERTSANADQYPNYVYFVPGAGCASYVGMQGGSQRLFLAAACSTGNTIHEIGHAVGLWHEHSRIDRDDYVDVRFENIYRGYEHNFDKRSADGEDLGIYDYDSIMHYPRWAFSKNGQDTIVPLQDDVEIGQRDGLSAGDIVAVEMMYGE